MLDTRTRVSVALHQANAELRSQTDAEKARHRKTFNDMIDNADYPSLALAETVRRLGRQRSMSLAIDPHTIEAAISAPKIFEGRL